MIHYAELKPDDGKTRFKLLEILVEPRGIEPLTS